ncbi:hypothetical protein WJX81_004344 [Elliptochloris bilobata]|uniref:TLC domain-containing protein n=1 Tax=Elliptochloris bilobata TaxID=381761 RepID=A0AAW1R317_9CHLO
MVTADFPLERVHAVALASAAVWAGVCAAAHFITLRLWPGYLRLAGNERLAWCNRIASALHAAVLVCAQARTLRDPILLADPLFAVSEAHFFWGSVMYGYLLYDTAFTLAFYSAVGSPSFLLHHGLGLASCVLGLYGNRMALFGAAIQVFFEGTTPLLHALGCLRAMHLGHTRLFLAAGMAFALQFFICRVLVGSYYGVALLRVVLALEDAAAWAWGGVAVYATLCMLNMVWFVKLVRMLSRKLRGRQQGSLLKGV